MSSGSAAIHLALLAAGIGAGDEVIVPALTFVAAAGMVRACGGTPVLCDSIGPYDHNLDPLSVADVMTDRTKVVLATHWWGYPCDMEGLQAICEPRGVAIVEDAAQAVLADVDGVGTLAGTVGQSGCFSLFSKKQLCVGEGGVVVTGDAAIADRSVAALACDDHGDLGSPSRPRRDVRHRRRRLQLPHGRAAPRWRCRGCRGWPMRSRRRAAVRAYRERLRGVEGVELPWSDEAVERSAHFCSVRCSPTATRATASAPR